MTPGTGKSRRIRVPAPEEIMVGRLLFGSAIALTLAMPAWAQGKAPDGTYSCETRSSGNIFMEVGSLTARGGQMTYRGAMPAAGSRARSVAAATTSRASR